MAVEVEWVVEANIETGKQIVQKFIMIIRLCVSVMLTFENFARPCYLQNAALAARMAMVWFLMKWGGREARRESEVEASDLSLVLAPR
jgi:hypothetical protein